LGVLVLAAVSIAAPANAQETASQIVGAWRYVKLSDTEVGSGKVSKPFGENPKGYAIYTQGGHVLLAIFGEGREKPATPFKDEDRVKLFSTLGAAGGKYKVEGNELIVTYDSSWHERWTNVTQKRTIEIKGNTLTLTSAPAKNAAGIETVFTVVLEKVE
jgi:Lipocalin-like domain